MAKKKGLPRNIRMKHKVETKGVTIKKGETVKLVEYQAGVWGRDYVTDYATVEKKGYGRVRIPKRAIHKTVKEELRREHYKKRYPKPKRKRKKKR